MLKVDFYESGKGETIIINFPDDTIGIVDAHPSIAKSRPSISELTKDKDAQFICLTHPHEDHGLDLIKAFSSLNSSKEFWHSIGDIASFVFSCTQQNTFTSPVLPYIQEIRKKWANFLIDLYYEIKVRGESDSNFLKLIDTNKKSVQIGDATFHFLSPDESERNRFSQGIQMRLEGGSGSKPNENYLSIVILIEYGNSSVLLGADALKSNWRRAIEIKRKNHLPSVGLLKVPHHGADNAWSHMRRRDYLKDLCENAHSVLCAGDSQHPTPRVFKELKNNSKLICVANGLKGQTSVNSNPPLIDMDGAVPYGDSPVCNPIISFEMHKDGRIKLVEGNQCSFCAVKP